MNFGGIKRDPTDDAFSRAVRERSDWTCESCHRVFHGGQATGRDGGLHASHLFGRRTAATRWDPDNCFAHCVGCHKRLGENPPVFSEWAIEALGEDRYWAVRRRFNCPGKGPSKDVKKEIRAHYQAEYQRLKDLRAAGASGRIEITNWRPYE